MSVKYSVVSIPVLQLRRGLSFLSGTPCMEKRYKDPLKKIEGRITGDPDKSLPVDWSEAWRVGWLFEDRQAVPWFYLQLMKGRAIVIFPSHSLSSAFACFSREDVKEYFECEFKDAPELECNMADEVPF